METSNESRLEEQVELLKEQLKAATGSDQELGVLMAIGKGMTKRTAIILHLLVKRAPALISRESFHIIMYGDRTDGGPEPKIFDVHVSRLRGILQRAKCPGKIDTVWNAGYRANPDLAKWVKDLYETKIPKE